MLPEMNESGLREGIKKKGDFVSGITRELENMMPNWKIKRQTLPNYQFHLGQSRSRDKSMEIMEEGRRRRRY